MIYDDEGDGPEPAVWTDSWLYLPAGPFEGADILDWCDEVEPVGGYTMRVRPRSPEAAAVLEAAASDDPIQLHHSDDENDDDH